MSHFDSVWHGISHNHPQTTAKALSSCLYFLWLVTATDAYSLVLFLCRRCAKCSFAREADLLLATVDRFARTVQNFPTVRWLSYQCLLAHNFITKYRKKARQTAANDLRMLQAYPTQRVQVPRRILKFIVGKLRHLHMLHHLRDNFGVDYYSHTHFPSVYTPSPPWDKFMLRSYGLGSRGPLLMSCLIHILQN